MSDDLEGGPLGAACPAPTRRYPRVVLAHGGGGRLGAELVREVFLPRLGNPVLARAEDQGTLDLPAGPGRLAVTTDSFVVRPLFFPGGDIGSLAVHGTVNDLAVGGARPLALTAGFVLEEGFPVEDLERLAHSMGEAARAAGVEVLAADTKVVDRGKGDGVYVNTTGVGWVPEGRALSSQALQPGDAVLVSGTVGDHGAAIMAQREGLDLSTSLASDSAAVHCLCEAVLEAGATVRVMRDPTRGGLATVLNELAAASQVAIEVDEAAVPVRPEARAVCEVLGLDPLYVACEGRVVVVALEADAERVLSALRSHPLGRGATRVATVAAGPAGQVTARSVIGGERFLGLLAGEQLPRIC